MTIKLYGFSKYAFYDSLMKIKDLNMVRSDAYYISRQRSRLSTPAPNSLEANAKSMVFDPKSKGKTVKYSDVFGGSTKTATKSSRRDVSYRNKTRKIAGVIVPSRPIEPDNCCMSGCINCVWELFNEDLEDWRHKRIVAAQKLMKQDIKNGNNKIEYWPSDWEVPPSILDKKFILHDKKDLKHSNKIDEVKGMPVGLQAFAAFEKRKKEAKEKASKLKESESDKSLSKSKSTIRSVNTENIQSRSETISLNQ